MIIATKGTSSERTDRDRILEMERDLLLVATVEVGLRPLVINLKIASPRITFMPTNIDSSKKINTRFCCFLVDFSVNAVEVDCYCHYL